MTPFSHLDFPNHLSCIVWFCGCNMRCDYCYNDDIVFSKIGTKTLADVIEFLKKRVGLLEAVVLSGGEATTYDLSDFCGEVKELGFKIKLDTNGVNFIQIKKLIESNSIDFVALDYKAPKYKFEKITKSNKFENFSKSLEYLIDSKIDFEVRTTIHNDLIDEVDINCIIDDLYQKNYQGKLYLQNFLETDSNIAKLKRAKNSFKKDRLKNSIDIIWRN